MRLWRLTRQPFADLGGEGARLYGGRWNSPGLPMTYLATEAALAVLEVRVHLDLPPHLLPRDYVLMAVEAEEGLDVEAADLPAGEPACRALGDGWLRGMRTALLSVPSAIVPESRNMLLNPRHPDAAWVRVTSTRPFRFDERLFGRG